MARKSSRKLLGLPDEFAWPSPPQLAKDKGWLGGGNGKEHVVVDGGMGVYTTDPKDFGGKGSDKGDLFEDLPMALEDIPIHIDMIPFAFAKKSGYVYMGRPLTDGPGLAPDEI